MSCLTCCHKFYSTLRKRPVLGKEQLQIQYFPHKLITTGVLDADLRHMSGDTITVICAVASHLCVLSHLRLRPQELKLAPAAMAALALEAEASPGHPKVPMPLDINAMELPEAEHVGPVIFKQSSTPYDTLAVYYKLAQKDKPGKRMQPEKATSKKFSSTTETRTSHHRPMVFRHFSQYFEVAITSACGQSRPRLFKKTSQDDWNAAIKSASKPSKHSSSGKLDKTLVGKRKRATTEHR